jgi:hypothetical protein
LHDGNERRVPKRRPAKSQRQADHMAIAQLVHEPQWKRNEKPYDPNAHEDPGDYFHLEAPALLRCPMMRASIRPRNPEDPGLFCIAGVGRAAFSAICFPSALRELIYVRVYAVRGLVMGYARCQPLFADRRRSRRRCGRRWQGSPANSRPRSRDNRCRRRGARGRKSD